MSECSLGSSVIGSKNNSSDRKEEQVKLRLCADNFGVRLSASSVMVDGICEYQCCWPPKDALEAVSRSQVVTALLCSSPWMFTVERRTSRVTGREWGSWVVRLEILARLNVF